MYGSQNVTEDVDYSVYFNLTGAPPASSSIAAFGNYTQKAGSGGVLFYVGAMPAGNTRITFVNKGATPLGECSAARRKSRGVLRLCTAASTAMAEFQVLRKPWSISRPITRAAYRLVTSTATRSSYNSWRVRNSALQSGWVGAGWSWGSRQRLCWAHLSWRDVCRTYLSCSASEEQGCPRRL